VSDLPPPDPRPLDRAWRAANPLPDHGEGTDKNARGRVLAVGGSAAAPGAIRLTAEAALRVGAGKVQVGLPAPLAPMLGLLLPEIGLVPLPQDADGEIAAEPADALCRAAGRCDALVLGPGIADRNAAARLVRVAGACARDDLHLVLDAAAVACAGPLRDALAGHAGRTVMTPHHGEMAALTGKDADEIAADPAGAARSVAASFGAVVILKDAATVIACPDGACLHYPGGGIGLATGGSGDVLAGAVAGLLSRGASPLVAAAWAVWLHGEAGRALATRHGPVGLLAHELPPEFPALLPR